MCGIYSTGAARNKKSHSLDNRDEKIVNYQCRKNRGIEIILCKSYLNIKGNLPAVTVVCTVVVVIVIMSSTICQGEKGVYEKIYNSFQFFKKRAGLFWYSLSDQLYNVDTYRYYTFVGEIAVGR